MLLANAGYFSAKSGMGRLRYDVSKYGEDSYRLTPVNELPAGEFGFSGPTSIDVFCFGVDAPKVTRVRVVL